MSVPLVLVADDVASLRLLYATLLTGEGYRVVEARDGLEALERIRSDHPDLLITDISMPRMDGIQVLEALRRAGSRLPVLVITAHKERETVLAAAQRGIVSYLTKPINISEFRDRVRRTLVEQGALASEAPGASASPEAGLDEASKEWLAGAPADGWTLQRLDEFLQAGEDLGELVASSQALGLSVELSVEAGIRAPALVEHAVYRVVQEALTNVHRHAAGARTTVTVGSDDDGLRLVVRDSGGARGPRMAPGGGHGLLGISERVRLIGGTLRTRRLPNGGFEVLARLPMTAMAREIRR